MKLQQKIMVLFITLLFIFLTTGNGFKVLAQTKTNEDLTSMALDLLDEQGSRLDEVERKSQMDRINFTGDYRFQAHKIESDNVGDNSLLYTNRLRFNFGSKMTPKLRFKGRLSMYKAWGDSTGVQVFNGQPNSMNIDGTTTRVPNSDILRVERAFFTWDIKDSPFYISIGRRPSTDGPPLHIRQGTPMGGTPMGTLVDFQFDGITIGCRLEDYLDPVRNIFSFLRRDWAYDSGPEPFLPSNTFRLCYGVGYDAGFGNMPNNGLEDTTMAGFDWDIFHNEDMFIQLMYMQAKDVTDAFNGLMVMPLDPVSGQPNNYISRYSPSVNLGNLTMTGLVFSRHDAFVHYFLSWAQMESDPQENAFNPMFGGLFCDYGETPTSQTGNLLYMGARADLDYFGGMMIGLEYNKGSQYWFNFAHGADDILGSKLATRGSVFELYSIFTLNRWANLRLGWQNYDYQYSGSGWHMGTPQSLDSSAKVISFATNIRF